MMVRDDDTGRFVPGHAMPQPWREKIRVATKGSRNPFYGKQHTDETRARIRSARAKQDMSWRKGVFKHSPETIAKISANRRAANTKAERSHLWKGGCEYYNKNKRKELDNYTCARCGLRDEEIMDADHIIPKSIAPHLKHDINNLQTLCPNCHKRKTLAERRDKIIDKVS